MIQARSTFGRRASICEKFGWTMDYLQHGISWAYIVRCLIDMPRYEYQGKDSKQQKTKLTAENAKAFAAYINQL